MPGGDKTGPGGMGPMTGRGAGYCSGYSAPGYANAIPGRFWGRSFGWGMRGGWGGGGRGWRNRFYATGQPGWMRAGWAPAWGAPPVGAAPSAAPGMTEEQEVEALQQQADYLKSALDEIAQRLDELKKE